MLKVQKCRNLVSEKYCMTNSIPYTVLGRIGDVFKALALNALQGSWGFVLYGIVNNHPCKACTSLENRVFLNMNKKFCRNKLLTFI